MKNLFLYFFSIFFLKNSIQAQTETFSTGSFIINMGATNPNTIANGLKPYGMIYDLMKNNNVPIKWVISNTKLKDGEDFNYNGVSYKGGTFIIPADNRTAAVNAKITSWQAQGVIGVTTTSPLILNVTRTLKAVPRWTLDAANGIVAQAYLNNAGIPTTAYNWKAVATLDCCDDFYVMPHAEPTWATHNRLFSWNKDCLGSIWVACHAVSALENSINPANAAQQMNFLTTRTAVVAPSPYPNNSLKLWTTHVGGTPAYTHQLFSDPVAQYMGVTDAAMANGSEQTYIPKQSTDAGGATRWNPGATIIAYDPTQADVPLPNLAGGNVAALMVYGRGMDDPARGFVMYEGGHSHNKGTTGDVAAQRAFLNYSFFQVQPKAPQLTFAGITSGQTIAGNATITGLNVGATSPLTGITFTYQWSSSCGGIFSNATGVTTNFIAPTVGATTNCIISCVVTDNCGRSSFQSFPVTILGATPPTAISDAQSIDPGCGAATVTKNVLANDVEPDGQPMTLTQINGNTTSFTTANGGLVSFTANGNVTYTSALGYVGAEVLTYRVCDNSTPSPLCTNATYTITIGNIANVPNAVNDAVAIAEDAILSNFNVLANDLPLVSGPITVSGIAIPPANGKVSINTDNTITYVPNADFAGTDVITYRIVNALGYSKTATLTVTVTNDACDGGTFQSGSGATTPVSGNDWSKVYTRPVNTGGIKLTNTVSYPINASTNRLLVVAISAGGPNGITAVPTVTWGGRSLTSSSVNRLDNNRAHSFIYYLKEGDIAIASGNNLIVNMGVADYYGYVVYAAVYKDVDQTTTVRNAVSPTASAATGSPITATTPANFVAGDQGIFVSAYSVNGGTAVATYSTVSSNWTGNATLFGGLTSSSGSIGPYYGGVGVRNVVSAATGETVSLTVTATNSLRANINVVSFNTH
jgi:Bacterial Ig domain